MPVVGKSAAELAERAETFRHLANDQLQQQDFKNANVAFSDASANILAEAYFSSVKHISRPDYRKPAAQTGLRPAL